ncbi:DUF2911 domain-containing protein [Robertkochia aurantiaca]|uniref:DUF2911 domain-containing protein n=1 Tax=Robertkochia aurantiaca TaxID=2873700 RepID=UPI001CC9FF80|nr:DUF2911 domain-containing protein [Robertkochia sp. 3YJGBD-33]
MKRFLFTAMSIFAFVSLSAQIQTPAPSPSAKLEQKVGLTDVSVVYSRPSMKGRTVFGELVPFDKVWRTGANQNTIVTFSDNVKIGGQELEKGSYAVFSKPGKENWEVYFYTDTNNWGIPQEWDQSKVAASATVKAEEMPMPVETFTITIDDVHNNGAELGMIWENTYVAVPFEVPTKEKAMASIDKVMNGPSANDYFGAAVYYLEEGQDLEKAQEWIDMAIAKADGEPYWMLRQKSLIHAARGDKEGAVAAAKKSLEAAEAAGNADYVALNKKSLEEWGAM